MNHFILSIIVLSFAILLRGVVSIKKHIQIHGDNFSFKSYFDVKHSIRWVLHIISSILCFIGMPELLILVSKWVPGVENFIVIPTALIGYIGYDLIRWFEFLSMIGVKKINKNFAEKLDKKITNHSSTSENQGENESI